VRAIEPAPVFLCFEAFINPFLISIFYHGLYVYSHGYYSNKETDCQGGGNAEPLPNLHSFSTLPGSKISLPHSPDSGVSRGKRALFRVSYFDRGQSKKAPECSHSPFLLCKKSLLWKFAGPATGPNRSFFRPRSGQITGKTTLIFSISCLLEPGDFQEIIISGILKILAEDETGTGPVSPSLHFASQNAPHPAAMKDRFLPKLRAPEPLGKFWPENTL